MVIDKLGNKVYTEHEIKYIFQFKIRSTYSNEVEANLNRILNGMGIGIYDPTQAELDEINDYKDFLLQVRQDTNQAIADNQLLINTIAYETALARVAQYRLAEGREAQTIYKTDNLGNQVVDYVIPSIEPLPAQVDSSVFNEQTMESTVVQIPNPLIVQDDLERAEAQSVIDNVSQAVLDLHALRNA